MQAYGRHIKSYHNKYKNERNTYNNSGVEQKKNNNDDDNKMRGGVWNAEQARKRMKTNTHTRRKRVGGS